MRGILKIGLIVFLIAVGAMAFFGSRTFLHRGHHPATDSAGQEAVYYCPMHPTYTSPRPGNCPICSMKLVKRETPKETDAAGMPRGIRASSEEICVMHNCPKLHEGRPCPMLVLAAPGEKVTCPICGTHIVEAQKPESVSTAGYAAVLITPKKQQLIGIRTAPVGKQKMVKKIRTAGRVAFDPELYQAEAEYLQALRAVPKTSEVSNSEIQQQAQQLLAAARVRLRLLGLSDALIQEMEGWSGPDQALLLTDAQKRVWIYAAVYELDLPWVKVGQTATVEVPSVPGKTFAGTIRAIDPVLDAKTRSARARFTVLDPEGILKPEMFVNVSCAMELGEVVSVPQEAVFDTGLRKIIFVAKGQGLFEPRELMVGASADGFYEVKSGVAEGESVVVNGNFLVDSESRLKGALESMAPSTSSGQAPSGSGQATGGEHHHGQ